MLKITSLQNSKVKELLQLRESRHRRETGLFLIEGARELERALASAYQLRSLFFCPTLLSESARHILVTTPDKFKLELTEAVFAKAAVRESSDGILAVLEQRSISLEDLKLPAEPWLLVLEDVEKPGNQGALARTADGAGVDALIVLDPKADLYNPHAVRASVGALFSRPLVACGRESFLRFCQDQKIRIVTASPFASRFHFEAKLDGAVAIVLGSEARGLSDAWQYVEHQAVKIPMCGLADSLNVSVAGAVILYESLRQRSLKTPRPS
jgi:TrmH family RNA methyltransferase